MKQISTYTQANKAAWDISAKAHLPGLDALKDKAAKPGFSTFDPTLTKLLETLELGGKRAAQIGCNNARELLSLASFGAIPAMGLDQSSGFLDQARDLAAAAGQTPQFLNIDIYNLPTEIDAGRVGQFDIVLITIGVLNWMPDLPRFFAIVARLLAPGGQLVIYETHPFLEVFDPASDTPFEPAFDYFATEPDASDEVITYDGTTPQGGTTSYWFTHGFADIVMGVLGAGLTLDHLREYPHSNREVDYDIYEGRAARIPMCYSLIATKAAS